MNQRCKAKTRAGTPCKAVAIKDGFCSLHADPNRAAELGRKSGQARRYVRSDDLLPELQPPRTAQEVREVVGQAISDVRARRIDTRVASSIGYLSSVLLKAIETSDLEQRVASLEATNAKPADADQHS